MESGFFEGFERERSARNSADDGEAFEPVGDQSTDVDPASEVAAFVNRPRPAQAPAATASSRSQQQQGGTRTVLSEMGFFR